MDVLKLLRTEWDRALGVALIVAGVIALILGYVGVSNSPYVASELAYIISGGIGGLFLLGLGAALLIMADLHDEWRKLDRIEAAIRGESPDHETNGATGAPTAASAFGTGTRVGVGAGHSAMSSVPEATSKSASPSGRGQFLSLVGIGPIPLIERQGLLVVGGGSVVGLGVIVFAWHRAHTVSAASAAIDAVAVGVVGLMIAALAAMAGTFLLRRLVSLRRSRYFAFFEIARLSRKAEAMTLSGVAVPSMGDSAAVVYSGELTRYHRPGCPAVIGLAVQSTTRDQLPLGLQPCGLCDPG
jgi:hypothetical protein